MCEHDLPGETCDAEHPGTLESCPMGDDKGCLISQYKDENTGMNQYTRACIGRDDYKCSDYQGGEGGDFHECVCQEEGCNKDWATAGDNQEQTTPHNPQLSVRIE